MRQLNEAEQTEVATFIQVTVGESNFLFPIDEVKEISELPVLRPYPIQTKGQVGVANIRGTVIPVLSMSCFFDSGLGFDEGQTYQRLVVLSGKDGEAFGVLVKSVKKVTAMNSTGPTIRLNNSPMRLISCKEVLKGWGVEAC